MEGNHLRHFTEQELLLSENEARTVLLYFFTAEDIQAMLTDQPLNLMHRQFAQALLVEAIDRSYAMGYAHILFLSAFGGWQRSPKKIIERFAKKATSHWFKNATVNDLWDQAKIYESVRSAISVKFSFIARGLLNGTEHTY